MCKLLCTSYVFVCQPNDRSLPNNQYKYVCMPACLLENTRYFMSTSIKQMYTCGPHVFVAPQHNSRDTAASAEGCDGGRGRR